MKRIAILGCENSHADAFLSCIRNNEKFADVEVIGVYSDEPEASERLHQGYGVPVLASYGDALGKIDALVITARHGDNHFKYALPYIESGVAMFIDKPITICETEAIEFMRALREHKVKISGGSSLKQDESVQELARQANQAIGGATIGGYVRAPYEKDSPYGGFFFYAQHLVEIVIEIFGRRPRSVSASYIGDKIQVLFHYDAYDAVGLYCPDNYFYYACRMSDAGADARVIEPTTDWYAREFEEFYELISGGEQKIGYEEFIVPVFIMNAIVRSLASGKEETVGEPKL